MIGLVIGEGVLNKYDESTAFKFWQKCYNKYQVKIMKLSLVDLKGSKGIQLIKCREFCFNRMSKYKVN